MIHLSTSNLNYPLYGVSQRSICERLQLHVYNTLLSYHTSLWVAPLWSITESTAINEKIKVKSKLSRLFCYSNILFLNILFLLYQNITENYYSEMNYNKLIVQVYIKSSIFYRGSMKCTLPLRI